MSNGQVTLIRFKENSFNQYKKAWKIAKTTIWTLRDKKEIAKRIEKKTHRKENWLD